MNYPVVYQADYDFAGQSYADCYPNLHPYPASMIPQLGIKILKELKISQGALLDPYCGSGSSFASALDLGLSQLAGCDLNPLAHLICRVKFTPCDLDHVELWKKDLEGFLIAGEANEEELPTILNRDYWFAPKIARQLAWIYQQIVAVRDSTVRDFLSLPFVETVRLCSYTRKSEFKLYRIADIQHHQPDVLSTYLSKLDHMIKLYRQYYLPQLAHISLRLESTIAHLPEAFYDVVLTSPPYGDSKTTVAYGQFSLFANEWLGITGARQLDAQLMGGRTVKQLFGEGVIAPAIQQIHHQSPKRALEVSSFYFDLAESIHNVAQKIKPGGYSIYVVGNRTVKQTVLPTDQFIAEQFVQQGFQHCLTYARKLSNKVMPSRNSPSNIKGQMVNTMLNEYIIVCQKHSGAL